MATGLVSQQHFVLGDWRPERTTTSSATERLAPLVSSVAPMAPVFSQQSSFHGRSPPTTNLPSFSKFLSETGQHDIPYTIPANGSMSNSRQILPMHNRGGFQDRMPEPLPRFHDIPPNHLHTNSRGPPRYNNSNSSTTIQRPLSGSVPPPALLAPLSPMRHPNQHSRSHSSAHPVEGGQARHLIGEEPIPGKGICYIYDDGSICQKVIDGDTVNPKWGTTKAGKPRKRLGQACNTCREKKIKCDPSVPKCAQCQKFNRECKFESTSRSSQKSNTRQSPAGSPTTSDATQEGSAERRGSAASVDTMLRGLSCSRSGSRGSRGSLSVDNLLSSPPVIKSTSEDVEREHQPPTKKLRYSTPPRASFESHAKSTPTSSIEGSFQQHKATFHLNLDPCDVDLRLTLHYLERYFVEINNPAYQMFPHRLFMKWARECRTKSKWDRMLLYAMLASGSSISSNTNNGLHEKFLQIAEEGLAESAGLFNLQVIQTRLVMARVRYAEGQANMAWELMGAASRTAIGMGLNMEDRITQTNDQTYGFDRATLNECKRRTFWITYIMDCFNWSSTIYMPSIQPHDCHLRLPCSEDMYERGQVPEVPFFQDMRMDPQFFMKEESSKLGSMAFLVQISILLSEIVSRVVRSKFNPGGRNDDSYERFYQDTKTRLQVWDKALKRFLQFSPVSRDSTSSSSTDSPSESLYILHHNCMISLNRWMPYKSSNHTNIKRNVQECYWYSRKLLELIQNLSYDDNRNPRYLKFGVLGAHTAHGILNAVDVITAAGMVSELLEVQNTSTELISNGIEILDELAVHWSVARDHRDQITKRFRLLYTPSKSGASFKKKAFFIRRPMVGPTCNNEEDLVYGLPRFHYLQALGVGDRIVEDDIYELEDPTFYNTASD